MPVVLWPSPHPRIRCLLQSTRRRPGSPRGSRRPGSLCAEEQALLRNPAHPPSAAATGCSAAGRPSTWWPAILRSAARESALGSDRKSLRSPAARRSPRSGGRTAHARSLSTCPSATRASWSFCALTNAPRRSRGRRRRDDRTAAHLAGANSSSRAKSRPRCWRGLQSERDLLITLVWSAKEAFLKCIKAGLRVDTRSVVVDIPPVLDAAGAWKPLFVTAAAGAMPEARVYRSWWRQDGAAILTLGLLTPPASVDLT